QRSAREQRDGERALREARSVQAEQRDRLQALQEQQEQLRRQEQRLHQANPPFPSPGRPLARQREQLQQLRDELSPSPGTLLGTGPIHRLGSTLAAPGAPGLLPTVGTFLGDSGDHLGSAALYGHLLLLKHRAQMDHDFLENERIFLESLKKGP
ncbi:FBF1 factor, partial [Chaetops frenatus]|nr:FBF1 factor [Chaetops frenatus]